MPGKPCQNKLGTIVVHGTLLETYGLADGSLQSGRTGRTNDGGDITWQTSFSRLACGTGQTRPSLFQIQNFSVSDPKLPQTYVLQTRPGNRFFLGYPALRWVQSGR